MVMLNSKTYAPSSYVGSPRFTRMEKTARTTFSDREKYPTTKEVRLLLTLRLVSVIVTGYRSSIRLCIGRILRKRTSVTFWRRGCPWTTWFTMEAWWHSIRTSLIIVPTTCLSTTLHFIISSTSGFVIWTPSISHGTLLRVLCAMRHVWGTASGP